MNLYLRSRAAARRLVFAAIALLAAPSAAVAQPLPYAFTRITDSVATPGLGGVYCLGMNDLGTVVVHLGNGALLRGRDPSSLTIVHPAMSGICPSINDSDEVAYMKSISGSQVLVRDASGSETTLASSIGSPALYAPTTYLPSLNDAGRAAYVAQGGTTIAVAPTGTTLTPPPNFVSPASMSDGDVIAFAAFDSSSSKAGLYRGSTVPLLQDGDAISGGTIVFSWLQRPGVNNAGTVAFLGRLDVGGVAGPYGVYTTDGSVVTLVGTSPVDRFSLNDSGAVVYRKTLSGGAGSGLYLGRPGLIDQEVIGQGDALDGSTVTDAFIWEESLNDLGQVAFWAHLADGRQGVYVATPKWLDALSFKAKVPACGPISAKVTLTTIAPPGGLTVDLATTHPSASIPTHVVVPAGKTTVSFSILPTPVLANRRDDIEATYGAQTIARVLTIRPITVKSVSLTPNPVIGGNAVVGIVKLDCAAQPSDLSVALASTKPSLAAPTVASLVIPRGSDNARFDVTTNPVSASTSATIKASALGTTKGKKLVLNP